jgi:hypothetical protein
MSRAGQSSRARATHGLPAFAAVLLLAGCHRSQTGSTFIPSPYSRPTLIAVAPALNFSGSSDFDTFQVADLLASELMSVEGIQVLGVNRVMAVLVREGAKSVTSPAHALQICEQLGCDGIVVFAVTEYDAYTPVVGLAVQLYMPSARPPIDRFDPVAASREASPFPVETSADSALRPRAQVQRVYNAAHNVVAEAVEKYGKDRNVDEGPLGWRRYLKSQRLYVRFCCWSAIRELMGQEYGRVAARTADKE